MKKAICAMLLAVLLLSGCMEPVEIPDAVPQERMRWQNPEGFELGPPPSDRSSWPNPHGWGLEPKPYNEIFY